MAIERTMMDLALLNKIFNNEADESDEDQIKITSLVNTEPMLRLQLTQDGTTQDNTAQDGTAQSTTQGEVPRLRFRLPDLMQRGDDVDSDVVSGGMDQDGVAQGSVGQDGTDQDDVDQDGLNPDDVDPDAQSAHTQSAHTHPSTDMEPDMESVDPTSMSEGRVSISPEDVLPIYMNPVLMNLPANLQKTSTTRFFEALVKRGRGGDVRTSHSPNTALAEGRDTEDTAQIIFLMGAPGDKPTSHLRRYFFLPSSLGGVPMSERTWEFLIAQAIRWARRAAFERRWLWLPGFFGRASWVTENERLVFEHQASFALRSRKIATTLWAIYRAHVDRMIAQGFEPSRALEREARPMKGDPIRDPRSMGRRWDPRQKMPLSRAEDEQGRVEDKTIYVKLSTKGGKGGLLGSDGNVGKPNHPVYHIDPSNPGIAIFLQARDRFERAAFNAAHEYLDNLRLDHTQSLSTHGVLVPPVHTREAHQRAQFNTSRRGVTDNSILPRFTRERFWVELSRVFSGRRGRDNRIQYRPDLQFAPGPQPLSWLGHVHPEERADFDSAHRYLDAIADGTGASTPVARDQALRTACRRGRDQCKGRYKRERERLEFLRLAKVAIGPLNQINGPVLGPVPHTQDTLYEDVFEHRWQVSFASVTPGGLLDKPQAGRILKSSNLPNATDGANAATNAPATHDAATHDAASTNAAADTHAASANSGAGEVDPALAQSEMLMLQAVMLKAEDIDPELAQKRKEVEQHTGRPLWHYPVLPVVLLWEWMTRSPEHKEQAQRAGIWDAFTAWFDGTADVLKTAIVMAAVTAVAGVGIYTWGVTQVAPVAVPAMTALANRGLDTLNKPIDFALTPDGQRMLMAGGLTAAGVPAPLSMGAGLVQ